MIPKISWLDAGGSILLLFHINLHWEAEDSLKVDKKSTFSRETELGAVAELFQHSHFSSCSLHSALLPRIAQRQEGKTAGAIIFFRYCRMDTSGVYETSRYLQNT